MYSPAMTDFVIMVENVGQMFVTGPEVVKEVLSQEVTFEELEVLGLMLQNQELHIS